KSRTGVRFLSAVFYVHVAVKPQEQLLIARGKFRTHGERGAQFAAGRNCLNSFRIFKRALFVMIGQPQHGSMQRNGPLSTTMSDKSCGEVARHFSRNSRTPSPRHGLKVEHGWYKNDSEWS